MKLLSEEAIFERAFGGVQKYIGYARVSTQNQSLSLLVSIAGTIGRTAVVSQEHVPANCNQAIALIWIDRSKAVASFIRSFLASVHRHRALLSEAVQLAQANLSLGQIAKAKLDHTTLDHTTLVHAKA
jgi:restriction endonuclease S subunit